MRKKDIEYAKKTISNRFPEILKDNVKSIILYGSCARGDFNDDSDIDVAILTDCSRIEAKRYDSLLMDVVTEIAMNTDVVVEYICIPYDEFSSKKSWYGFFGNIEKDGITIYG